MLHPQARAALREAALAPDHLVPGRPGFDLTAARAAQVAQVAEAGGGVPVARVSDVVVGGVACRLYAPGACAPLVVYLHGGGWTFGSLVESEPLCRSVADRSGWAVLAVDYRLAPEHPFPAALLDVEAVIAAVSEAGPGAGLDVDAARLAVAGDSAGANLATVAALRARDRGGVGWLLQVLLYPVVDLAGEDYPSRREFAAGYGLDRAGMEWHADAYVPDPSGRASPDVSPMRAGSLAGLPPALVITAGCDPLRDEAEAYAARLADDGVPCVCTRYPGMLHGFADPLRFDAADAVVDQIAGALHRAAE